MYFQKKFIEATHRDNDLTNHPPVPVLIKNFTCGYHLGETLSMPETEL